MILHCLINLSEHIDYTEYIDSVIVNKNRDIYTPYFININGIFI